jgi:hypothetical protein
MLGGVAAAVFVAATAVEGISFTGVIAIFSGLTVDCSLVLASSVVIATALLGCATNCSAGDAASALGAGVVFSGSFIVGAVFSVLPHPAAKATKPPTTRDRTIVLFFIYFFLSSIA